MIISRTPYRISFFGGGTDYPAWYRSHGGSVLATTIDKYCYLTCRYLPPFFEHNYRVVYSKTENCKTIDEISHPAVREILRFMNIKHGVELHHDGDLPARSGLGSSSSFTVGLLHALHALKGEMPSKLQLAKEAIHIEQECIKETVGSQDQVLAAFGGFNYILFHENEDIAVRPVVLPRERISELTSCLLMLYTGIKRTASDIADSYVSEIQDKRREMRIMTDLVNEALTVLNTGSHLAAFGELLHEAWLLKRSLSSKVSNAEVDDLYKTARDLGAKGGKLIGAGGGGFMLLFVEPDLQPRIRDRLSHLVYVPIQFEFTGSQIIFLDRPEEYLSLREEGARRETKPSRELTLSEE